MRFKEEQNLKRSFEAIRRVTAQEAAAILKEENSKWTLEREDVKALLNKLESAKSQLLHKYCKEEHQRITRKPDIASQRQLNELVKLLGWGKFYALSSGGYVERYIN